MGLIISHLVLNGLLVPIARAVEHIHGVACPKEAFQYLGIPYVVDDVALLHVIEEMTNRLPLATLSVSPLPPMIDRFIKVPPPPPPTNDSLRGPILHPSLSHLLAPKIERGSSRSSSGKSKKGHVRGSGPRNWSAELTDDNPVSKLHEYCTWRGIPPPDWRPSIVNASEGAPVLYGMECTVDGHSVSSACIRSRKQHAKNDAARLAFYSLGLIEMKDEDVLLLTNGQSEARLPSSSDVLLSASSKPITEIQPCRLRDTQKSDSFLACENKPHINNKHESLPVADDQENKWAANVLVHTKKLSIRSILNVIYQKFNLGKLDFTIHDIWPQGSQSPIYFAELPLTIMSLTIRGRWAYQKKDSAKEQVAAEALFRLIEHLGYPQEKNPDNRAAWPLVHNSLRQLIEEWNHCSLKNDAGFESSFSQGAVDAKNISKVQIPPPSIPLTISLVNQQSTAPKLLPAVNNPISWPCSSSTNSQANSPVDRLSINSSLDETRVKARQVRSVMPLFPFSRPVGVKKCTTPNSSSTITRWGA